MQLTRRQLAALTGSTMLAAGALRGASAQEHPTITYWMESASGSDKIQWVIDNIIGDYNSQGGVQVEAIVQPEIWTATHTALAGGAGPDVVFTPGPTFVMELAKAGMLAPLDPYVEEYGWADTFHEWALGLGTVDGQLYSLPSEVETMVLYYNVDLFDEHGWTPPTTIDELITLADEVNEAGIVPFAHTNAEWRPANEHYLGEFLNKIAGPENIYRALRGELPWTDGVFAEALEPLNEFQAKGYFSGGLDRYYTTASADAAANLAYGDAAMKIDGTWWVPDAHNFFGESGMQWDWTPMPSKDGTPSFSMAIGSTYSINAGSEYHDEVADFLGYYFTPETQARIKVGSGMDTAPVEIEESLLEGLDERESRLVSDLSEAAESGNYGYTTWTFFPPRTQVFMYEEIEKVWAGDLTVEDYLAQAQTIFEDDLANDRIPPLPERSS